MLRGNSNYSAGRRRVLGGIRSEIGEDSATVLNAGPIWVPRGDLG